MLPHLFVIRSRKLETSDTFTLELEPIESGLEFSFLPGQYNMIYVFGVGEVPISISSDPRRKNRISHTTRMVGTVTKAMGMLKKGDVLGIRGPFGTSWPVDRCENCDIVIVAGGIGLAPLRPAIYYILANRERYNRVILLYGARTPEDILYKQEIEKWKSRFDFEVYVTVDRGTSGWKGNVGVVTTLIPRAPFESRNSVAFVCGPEVMMRFTAIELVKRGVKEDNIFISMERNMKCGIGLCGHCQFGPVFVCKDGPVFSYNQVKDLLFKREI
ncbi:MAG: FAD/NAD(P)-binding protein [Candidatus Kryptonium sp.]|nr:FAD/NAD(P)-binding protein [Candidatus Kryptonium sp.]